MMIYLSMVGLIDSLLTLSKKRKVNFVAVDSSFSVMFRVNGGGVYIESTGERMGPFSFVELMKSILDGVVVFVNGGGGLGGEDSVLGDFNGAIDDLKRGIEGLQRS
ncbi:hypothetical protein [Burkholderia cepacia]|uniref:Uncharacterized protein n=1 Tax=Burkholderia cepacia TaxID=292 RepID=A0A8I1B3J4_BURCE|nr:hypothetical protein [Burkholderia cepacia]MBH9702170.1 hypothetical protein [Burkholderia cepacia]MBH9718147.1 hypothetical protein [Burkholderia cepacia]MBX3763647.1 hypothetical protein [Burkholderia cepacia]MBX3802300.1 hypothetical protein [Burkholderia cepacia]MBX3911596.1 hypothetical protein [Burkholderia cepacia]